MRILVGFDQPASSHRPQGMNGHELMKISRNKKERRARSSRLPSSPFGECPTALTEGGQPVVCWPAHETPLRRKKFRVSQKKVSKIRLARQVRPAGPIYGSPLSLKRR